MFIHAKPPMKPADVFPYVDEVADNGCTTLFMCACYGMPMNYPSKVVEMFGSELTPAQLVEVNKVGAEKAVSMECAAVNLRELVKAGHDPLGLVIERARQKKLEVFISFRMNEVHHANTPDVMPSALLITRYWREHPEWHVGKPGDKLNPTYTAILSSGPRPNPAFNWLPGVLNYAVPDVRKLRLDQLRECCERFPIDGLDLDFLRFPMYFRPGDETANVATMTSFIRQVREMTQEVGRQRGRPLLLSVARDVQSGASAGHRPRPGGLGSRRLDRHPERGAFLAAHFGRGHCRLSQCAACERAVVRLDRLARHGPGNPNGRAPGIRPTILEGRRRRRPDLQFLHDPGTRHRARLARAERAGRPRQDSG